MSYPPTGPSGWGNPDPRHNPQHLQPQYPPPQPQPGRRVPGHGAQQWGQPGPSGSWGTPPPPRPPRNSTGLIIGAIAAVVVVLVGVVITVVVSAGPDNAGNGVVAGPASATSTASSSGASADEGDLEAAAEKRVELINSQDAVGLHRMACEADSRTESTAGYQDLFDENGPISASIDVQDVVVDGSLGTVEGVMSIDRDSGDITWPFKKEDGQWRFCPSLSQSPTSDTSGDDEIITG